MIEQQRSELGPQKISLKLTPALGDWTTFKPQRALIKRVKSGIYGFDRLSKDELEKAHQIHYEFSEKLCEALKIDLGILGEIYSVEALQNNYSNFIKILSQPLVEFKISLPESHEDIFLSTDITLANTLINSMLGSRDDETSQRELNDTENSVLHAALSNYLSVYNESFYSILPESKLEFVSSLQPTPSSSISPNSSFVYFIIETKLNESFGKIVFGYSAKLIKSLIKKTEQVAHPPLKINRLSPVALGQSNQLLNILLGTTQISSSDLKKLESGDVILLDQSIFSALPAKLGEKVILLGQPSIKNGKIALKIVSVEKERARTVAPPPVVEEEEEKVEETAEEKVEEMAEEKVEEKIEGPAEMETEPFYEEAEKAPEKPLEEEEVVKTAPEEEFEEEYPEEEISSEEEIEEEEDILDEEIEDDLEDFEEEDSSSENSLKEEE